MGAETVCDLYVVVGAFRLRVKLSKSGFPCQLPVNRLVESRGWSVPSPALGGLSSGPCGVDGRNVPDGVLTRNPQFRGLPGVPSWRQHEQYASPKTLSNRPITPGQEGFRPGEGGLYRGPYQGKPI